MTVEHNRLALAVAVAVPITRADCLSTHHLCRTCVHRGNVAVASPVTTARSSVSFRISSSYCRSIRLIAGAPASNSRASVPSRSQRCWVERRKIELELVEREAFDADAGGARKQKRRACRSVTRSPRPALRDRKDRSDRPPLVVGEFQVSRHDAPFSRGDFGRKSSLFCFHPETNQLRPCTLLDGSRSWLEGVGYSAIPRCITQPLADQLGHANRNAAEPDPPHRRYGSRLRSAPPRDLAPRAA